MKALTNTRWSPEMKSDAIRSNTKTGSFSQIKSGKFQIQLLKKWNSGKPEDSHL